MNSVEKAPVYDILNAGPRSQFQTAAAVSHNCTAKMANDTKMIDALKQGFPIYEAHARATMGWTGGSLKEEDPKMYSLAKARVLALGYGAGPPKFQVMAKNYGISLTLEEAERTVAAYRASNKPITNLWALLDNCIKRSVRKDMTIELPSGRLMRWRNITSIGGMTAETLRGGRYTRTRLYGSMCLENIVQGTARDVLAYQLGLLLDEGLRPILHVHDEVILECREDDAEATLARLIEIMSTTPPWLGDLPIASEGIITNQYTK